VDGSTAGNNYACVEYRNAPGVGFAQCGGTPRIVGELGKGDADNDGNTLRGCGFGDFFGGTLGTNRTWVIENSEIINQKLI
jgi:hypothetical protein